MLAAKNKTRISISEIRELLSLRGWKYRHLAEEMETHIDTVQKWMDGARNPSSPASRLMLQMLEEARNTK